MKNADKHCVKFRHRRIVTNDTQSAKLANVPGNFSKRIGYTHKTNINNVWTAWLNGLARLPAGIADQTGFLGSDCALTRLFSAKLKDLAVRNEPSGRLNWLPV